MAKGKLKIHSENILPILKKSLYSDRDIFLRELVSNATDAIKKRIILANNQEVEFDEALARIEIQVNKDEKTITITDNGIGMSSDEVKNYIAQLAFSGAEEFAKKYASKSEDDQIIGHFGLGFYSSFMVSNKVELTTRSCKESDDKGVHWSSDGSYDYTIKDIKRHDVGTSIVLHVDEDNQEFLDEGRVRDVLVKYCGFLPYPIFLGDSKINDSEPIWLKKPSDLSDNDYKELFRRLCTLPKQIHFFGCI